MATTTIIATQAMINALPVSHRFMYCSTHTLVTPHAKNVIQHGAHTMQGAKLLFFLSKRPEAFLSLLSMTSASTIALLWCVALPDPTSSDAPKQGRWTQCCLLLWRHWSTTTKNFAHQLRTSSPCMTSFAIQVTDDCLVCLLCLHLYKKILHTSHLLSQCSHWPLDSCSCSFCNLSW